MRWFAVFLLLTVSANADSITRYYFRIHVFFDDGLKIFESEHTWGKFDDCEKAAKKDARRYKPYQMANYICEPVHFIINLGGKYT